MDLEMNSCVAIENGIIEFPDFSLFIENWADTEGLQVVTGPNGSGKSTFLRVILGLQNLKAGKRETILEPERFGYVPQNYRQALIPWETCKGNLSRFCGVDVETGLDMLNELGIPESDLSKRPAALSGGQCQRLALVRELLTFPKLLVLDEPFSSLDIGSIDRISYFLSKHIDKGVRVIIASHQRTPAPLENSLCQKVMIERYAEDKARIQLCA